ncbi:uncharacterized protein ARMOST_00063 [Armillaria ostoyae]|uniref:Uncharacterized protein n=1 Tax=Armillaria ostoyae TaxID=47428 RepID=A0A284QK31_ARMOS|nr:uncharacterized protein ARMOST_00063 [Armillaria ostoyae]
MQSSREKHDTTERVSLVSTPCDVKSQPYRRRKHFWFYEQVPAAVLPTWLDSHAEFVRLQVHEKEDVNTERAPPLDDVINVMYLGILGALLRNPTSVIFLVAFKAKAAWRSGSARGPYKLCLMRGH